MGLYFKGQYFSLQMADNTQIDEHPWLKVKFSKSRIFPSLYKPLWHSVSPPLPIPANSNKSWMESPSGCTSIHLGHTHNSSAYPGWKLHRTPEPALPPFRDTQILQFLGQNKSWASQGPLTGKMGQAQITCNHRLTLCFVLLQSSEDDWYLVLSSVGILL